MNDRLWELLTRYYADRLTEEEKEELDGLLLEYPDNWLKIGLLRQLKWKLKPALSVEKKEIMINRILGKKDTEDAKADRKDHWSRKRRKIAGSIALAVCIVVILSVAILVRPAHISKVRVAWQRISTRYGMKSVLHLPDGSEVWLNAGSTLRYNDYFNKNRREVYLTGEAYFIIKHNAAKPFIVHTAHMNIHVLGTEFDVKAYPGENFSEASLIKGSVEVIIKHHGQNQKIYLKPDQKVMIKNEQSRVSDINKEKDQLNPIWVTDSISTNIVMQPLKAVGNVIPETAWKENMLVFEDESLSSLVQRLDRWYGVNIVIKDSALAQQHFTGRADNVSLEKLLHILQIIKPFDYAIHGKEVIIDRKNK